MKELDEILKGCSVLQTLGNGKKLNGKIVFDSRKVEENDLFVAVRGVNADGHHFISSAVESGAAYIVCEEIPEIMQSGVTYVKVQNSMRALGIAAANFYGNPSAELKVVGITGTNGKTTIASLLFETTSSLGYAAGLLSTIKVVWGVHERPSTHTTPDPVQLQATLREMADCGTEYVFMEVSSHSVHQERIAGIDFIGGVFSNLSHDHLDYHGSFQNYLQAKKMYFDNLPANAFALINRDDRNGSVMVQNTSASVKYYSLRSMSDFRAKIAEAHFEGNLLQVNGEEIWTRLPGRFNAYNCLAVYSTCCLLGFDKDELMVAISKQSPVEGRFEIIKSTEGTLAIIDYAHTPDALKNVLETINELREGDKRLITITGAGGDRDRDKRPLMAKIAALNSDSVILTSDNPRSEKPEDIIEEMRKGLEPELENKVIIIKDRSEAIQAACRLAGKNDIILVAGKGHETYQEIKGVRYPFDDREKVRINFKID